MCESNVYIYNNGKEELYLESLDILIRKGNIIFLKNLFGEEKMFEGRLKKISLLKHKILLEGV